MAISAVRLPGLLDNRHQVNAVAFGQTNVDGNYAVWWDVDGRPIIGRHDGEWETFDLSTVAGNPLASPVEDDPHNVIVVAVDPDGIIHVAGNMHGDTMRYLRSTSPGDITSWTDEAPPGAGFGSITYPRFVVHAGALRVLYRTGGSGNANTRLQTWDGDSWSGATNLIDGAATSESAYLQTVVSEGGRLHIAWCWRGTTAANTNTDICHMSSADLTSWTTMAGDPVTLPVTHTTAPVVVETEPGEGLLNQSGMDVTASGNPHIAYHFYNDAQTASRILHVWWDGSWQTRRLFGDWSHFMDLDVNLVSSEIARPAVKAHGDRVLLVWRNNVDAAGSLWLSEITPGAPVKTASIIDVDLYAYEPTVGQSGLRLLVTRSRTADTSLPGYTAVNFSAQPAVILTVDLNQLDAVLAGTADVPNTLEDFGEGGTPGTPSGPAQSVATIRRTVVWLGCDVTSGKIIAELPDLTGQVSRALGAETSAACSTPIPLSGPGALGPQALQATEPKRTMVVAVVNDVPAWAGIVLRRDGGTAADLQLATVSPEGYLHRRKVRDHSFSQVDECTIMSTLALDAEDIDGVGQGLGLVHAIEPSGTLRDKSYAAVDKASVLTRMKELSRIIGGPEWTIDPEWADADKTVVQLVLRVADRIGVAASPPQAVFQATFDARSAGAASYTLTEDHTDGRGANWVVAISTGEGDNRPESDPHIDTDQLDAGVPIFEHHFSPGSDIGQDTLNDHAAGELVRLKDGTLGLKITSRWDQYPRFGVDFRLGDDVAWDLVGHRHPDGFTGTGRLIGWELDLEAGTLSPTLTGIQNG